MIEGKPGSGKTTLAKRASRILAPVFGFYTEEVRLGGRRIGFDVVPFSKKEPSFPLARTKLQFEKNVRQNNLDKDELPKVGKYFIFIDQFDDYLAGAFSNSKLDEFDKVKFPSPKGKTKEPWLIIDEIGKMELLSKNFCLLMENIFKREKEINTIATIGSYLKHPIAKKARQIADKIIQVSPSPNARKNAEKHLLKVLEKSLQKKQNKQNQQNKQKMDKGN